MLMQAAEDRHPCVSVFAPCWGSQDALRILLACHRGHSDRAMGSSMLVKGGALVAPTRRIARGNRPRRDLCRSLVVLQAFAAPFCHRRVPRFCGVKSLLLSQAVRHKRPAATPQRAERHEPKAFGSWVWGFTFIARMLPPTDMRLPTADFVAWRTRAPHAGICTKLRAGLVRPILEAAAQLARVFVPVHRRMWERGVVDNSARARSTPALGNSCCSRAHFILEVGQGGCPCGLGGSACLDFWPSSDDIFSMLSGGTSSMECLCLERTCRAFSCGRSGGLRPY